MHLYLIPTWFFSYSILFSIIFGIITLVVGLYALKVYRLSNQEQSKIFGIAFILIASSYFVRAITTLVLFVKLRLLQTIQLANFDLFTDIGIFIQITLLFAGFIALVYMTLRIKNPRLYFLLLSLCLAPLFLTEFNLTITHILLALILIYITGHYLICYLNNCQIRNITVLIAFAILMLVHIDLVFSLIDGFYYILGDILSFIAYLLILINLILITKK